MTLLYEDSFEIGQQSIGRWTDVMETLFETLQRCVGGGEESIYSLAHDLLYNMSGQL